MKALILLSFIWVYAALDAYGNGPFFFTFDTQSECESNSYYQNIEGNLIVTITCFEVDE